MPPKGTKAAKAKAEATKAAKAKRKRGGEADEEGSDSDKGAGNAELKLEHPAIPPAELNKMNANLRWMAKNGQPEALDEFLARTRPQKREWYWTW